MKLARFSFSNLKLAHQITLITGALALTVLLLITAFAAISSVRSLQAEAERSFRAQVEGVRQAADFAYQLAEARTESVTGVFQAKFKAGLTVDPNARIPVGGVETPLVKLGDTPINLNFKLVDEFTEATGATASVFVAKGDEFIRITTSNKNDKGERAVGVALGKDHQAYESLRAGNSYTGRSRVLNREHLSTYVPVKSPDGTVIAVLGVGYNLEEIKASLFKMMSGTKLGQQGYIYVVDAAPGKNYGQFVLHPKLQGTSALELADADDNKGFLKPLVDQKSGFLGYPWPNQQGVVEAKIVAYDRSEGWNWSIAGGAGKEEQTREGTRMAMILGSSGLAAAAALAFLLWAFIARRLRPLGHLTDVVQKLGAGDNEARAKLTTKDEIGDLGRAFDKMMDERVATQLTIESENEQLNNSVLSLLQAVAQLGKKDLTVKVPVAEDVTGAVGDALNMLTNETAKVLTQVTELAADVSSASLMVKQQSETVTEVANSERQQVEQAAAELGDAATSMKRIAELAQACNSAADHAIKTTQSALSTVNATVGGISGIRDTIRETEKRIKRLGERSQEISGVVSLINTIAERTHILALNASMHAASAGEAGRGFAVVADEVQRLAENARQATGQIATLVNNIQVETADTVSTMNATISQVVEGSKLAEQAGEQMKRTQETTAELVASVQQIAESSQAQARISSQLLERAGEIRKSTEQTTAQLREQSEQTVNLVEYAKGLMGAVRVFKLPA